MTVQTKVEATTLASAMALAFAEIEAATKAANNPHFKSKYADLSAVIDAVKPALINHGLFFTQHCHPSDDGVTVETVLGHAGGEEKSLGKLYVPANKKDAQGFGSALTYARRYGLMTAFGVPAEDDDGNAASKAVANDQTTREPVAREKLDGPHTSKTALRKAVNDIITKVRAAQSGEEIDAIQKDNIATIKQANRDWPILLTGDPNIPEDVGLKGAVEVRRAELSADDGQFKMLIDSMKGCQTSKQLANWMATNEPLIEALDGAESRKFQLALELHESALKQVALLAAG
jgi:hypothetical protein